MDTFFLTSAVFVAGRLTGTAKKDIFELLPAIALFSPASSYRTGYIILDAGRTLTRTRLPAPPQDRK